MVQMAEGKMTNYFRYDGSIERRYYRAIAALEKTQAGRIRRQQQIERTLPAAPFDKLTGDSSDCGTARKWDWVRFVAARLGSVTLSVTVFAQFHPAPERPVNRGRIRQHEGHPN
jgi:hypothetical protein